jgi:hypothetical protein
LPSNSSAERQSGPPSADCHPGIGFREFVALLAALMAVNALSIDAMLPVLPQIRSRSRPAHGHHHRRRSAPQDV